ncbi:MAG: hypothetical protein ACTS9Y_06060 [Methylophilus sp.]|uniref:hypothetical protein n=1 Tax=Methylophilus sp. TaxID=29541 RepID=UPI003F9F29E5
MPLSRYVFHYLLLLASLAPLPSFAEITTLPIPDQGWGITFDAPKLRPVREADSNDHYMYSANANNFAVTLNVDTPSCNGGEAHEELLNCFWSKASKDPLINPATVAKSCNSQYCKLSYDFENTFQDAAIKQKHVHYLFAYRGRWANLHVAVSNPRESDLQLLDKFAASLSYK